MFGKFDRFLFSVTAKSGISFASSGLSFAAANLILAHELSVEDYGVFALLVAIVMLIASVGMLGADGVVNRQSITPNNELFGRVALSSVSISGLGAFFAIYTYEIPAVLAALLIPTGTAFAMTRFCGAYLQSKLHLISSLLLANSLNYLLLVLALLALYAGLHNVTISFSVVALLQCVTAVGAVILVRTQFKSQTSDYKYSWRESLAFVFMASSTGLLVQLERLVTPALLGLEDLAILGVLLAIVGPPFRLIYLTFGSDLLPNLRKIKDKSARLTLVSKHTAVALLSILPVWIVIWFGVPLIQGHFLSDEYAMSGQLILAALVAGTVKGVSGIAQASVTALSSIRGMEIMGAVGWFSILCAVSSASYGAQFGLPGVVYGVTVGWAIRLAAAPVIVIGWRDDQRHMTDAGSRAQSSPGGSGSDRRRRL
jgi:O-antigen/teichoic acid export membrane protein